MSARDERLVALNEVNLAGAHIGHARERLRILQMALKRAGIQVEMLDLALADASSAVEYVHAARCVLWTAFTDDRKAPCA